MFFREPKDYEAFLMLHNTGTAETGAAQGYWLIQRASPHIKTVVIRRPLNEVVNSIMSVDVSGIATYDKDKVIKFMSYGERMLEKISKYPDVLTVDFHDLVKAETCKKVFEHCLPYDFDQHHWETLKDQNIQIDTKQLLQYRFKHKEEIDRFKRLCKDQLRHLRKTDPHNPVWKKTEVNL